MSVLLVVLAVVLTAGLLVLIVNVTGGLTLMTRSQGEKRQR